MPMLNATNRTIKCDFEELKERGIIHEQRQKLVKPDEIRNYFLIFFCIYSLVKFFKEFTNLQVNIKWIFFILELTKPKQSGSAVKGKKK